MKIGIIGGGAAGIFTAINAKNDNNEVIIFERNKDCGKKILTTGNGRCNYWNEDQSLFHYQSSSINEIEKLINTTTEEGVLNIFNNLGVIPKIKNGYYYPFSNQALTIKNVLIKELENKKVIIKNEFFVKNIEKLNNKFIVVSNDERVEVDKLVLATGSFAAPKTGSDGMGYDFLKKLGHTVVEVLPSLVGLNAKGNSFKDWNGIRTEAKLSLYENNKFIREEFGEVQLTNYGISGICTFNLSNFVARGLFDNKKEIIKINFLPFLEFDNDEEYINWFKEQTKLTNKNIFDMLTSIINEKLVLIILSKLSIEKNKTFLELSYNEQQMLIKSFIMFTSEIESTKTFNDAQVCSGGIPLTEINMDTMESKIVPNLYIVGELLDLTGDCGGYNLGIAWRSGLVAGTSIKGEQND